MNIQRPTPDTDAAFRDGYTFCREDMRPAVEFCANLERERDEALESKDRISKRAEAIRCELVEKDKQLESMRKTLIESEAYQAGLVADLEAMSEAVKEAYDALKLIGDQNGHDDLCQMFNAANAACSCGMSLTEPTITKLKPLLP